MANLEIQQYASFALFTGDWDGLNDNDARMLWQLLETLDSTEVLVQIPEWLAEKKVGFTDGATPTLFVGTIGKESEKAIRLDNSAAARDLMRLAHRLHHFEESLESHEDDADRRSWLESRREEVKRELETRKDAAQLREEWLPKSQIEKICRRTS